MIICAKFYPRVKQHIPNALTSFNLFCGCLSIVYSLQLGNLQMAAICIGIAAVVDFFDGFAARALGVSGELGKQLDSLADVVSFGVAPGFIFFMLSGKCFGGDGFCYVPYLSFLIPVFSALRLAKFNIDTRQSDSFIGLPTPANGIFIGSIPFIMAHDSWHIAWIFESEWFLKIFPLLSAWILVAELPLLALKFKTYGWKGNEIRYLLIAACATSIAFFTYAGIAISIVLYVLLSIINNQTNKKTT